MQEGGKEANPLAGQSRYAAQHPTDPRSMARAKKPPAPLSRRSPRARTTQPEQAQPARASGRTRQWGVLSRVQRGALRSTSGPIAVATRARLSRAARRLEHNPQRPTRPARHPRLRSSLRAWLRACVVMRNAGRATARRAVAAHPDGPSASHARMTRREGGSEGHRSPHPTTPRACTRARACAAHSRRKPDSSDRARPLGTGPPRPSRPIPGAPWDRTWRGGRGGAPSLRWPLGNQYGCTRTS